MPPVAEKIEYKYKVHDQELTDYYHWMRDPNWPNVKDPKIISYLTEENKYTDAFLKKHEDITKTIFEEIKGRIELDDISAPIKKGDYFYYVRKEADQQYSIYCRKKGTMNAQEEIILDVNKLAEGKQFTSVSALSTSPSQKLMLYAVDFVGDERYSLYLVNLETKQQIDVVIPSVSGVIVWHENEEGYFYVPMDKDWRRNKILYHKLGTDIKDDKIIFQESDIINEVSISKSSSKEFMIVESANYESSEIYYFSMKDLTFTPLKLLSRRPKIQYSVDHTGNYFFVRTNDQGANFRLAVIPSANPSEDKMEDYLKYDSNSYLSSFDVTKSFVIANYMKEALPVINIYRIEDKNKNTVTFPDKIYTAYGYSTNFEEDDIRVDYSSLKTPNTTFSYDYDSGAFTAIKKQKIPSGFNPNEYEVERVWSENNGVKIPVSLVYKKSKFKKDGTNPLYLYGYGSYSISVKPNFRVSLFSLLNRGFVFAIAHIRGGDDLGYEWYESAKLLNKKNTFEDFLAVAEDLIDKNYTSRGNVTISGGSAGGMLIGNAINDAPDLFKAAIAHVPFVDVMNTMLDETLPLTPGEFKEWGNPKDKEYFDYILSYSPYENVKKREYPNLWVTTSLSDQRVGYWEAAKWVAKLREDNIGTSKIFLKTDMNAGHAGSSGRFDFIKEIAEEYSFLLDVYNLDKNAHN